MNTDKTFDAELQLKDSYAMTASAAAKVSDAAKVVDLGAGRVDAKVITNVSAINNSAAANKYTLVTEGSLTSAFSAKKILATQVLGHATAIGEAAARGVGQWEQPFTNEVDGVVYPYVRQYVTIAGSPASITHTSYIAKKN